jgi:hypothetical protein
LPFLIRAALLFRLLFLVALPNLSQDYFRFIWDGHLILENINPYLELPKDLINQSSFAIPNGHALYNGMGSLSAGHSNYPPVNQFFSYCCCLLVSNPYFERQGMRLLLSADIGTFYFGCKLLANRGMENIVFFGTYSIHCTIELT